MTRRPRPASARTALRLAGLLVVLAGLFGMHGLANHGVAGMENMPHAVIASVSQSTAATGSSVISAHADGAVALVLGQSDGVVAAAAAMVSPVMPEGMDMSMMGMCMAVLVMGLGALLVLGRVRRPAPAWTLSRAGGATASPLGRDPDPPSLTVLSIQRC